MSFSAEETQSKTCVVGYALNAKKLRKSSHDFPSTSSGAGQPLKSNDSPGNRNKSHHIWKGGGLSDILESSSRSISGTEVSDTVTFVQLDHETPLANQPHCDVIIHKLTEDIDNTAKDSIAKLSALDDYLRAYPRTVIVDPMDSVRKVISRARTCSHLSRIEQRLGKNCSFAQPKYVIIENGVTAQQIAEKLTENGISFPIICKPIQACGTPNSHNMMVIICEADLYLIDVPCVVQQYHDHSEALYKVYVIDQDVTVFRRQSLPDLHLREAYTGNAMRSLAFDSRKNYPTYADFLAVPSGADASSQEGSSAERKSDPPSSSARVEVPIDAALFDACQRTAAAIREEFGLTLFGFDAILPNSFCNTNASSDIAVHVANEENNGSITVASPRIVVIDVNYFPSYKEVSDFPFRLKSYLHSRMHVK